VPEAHPLHARTKPRVLFVRLVVSYDNSAGETYHDKGRGKGTPSYKGHRDVENEAHHREEVITPTRRREHEGPWLESIGGRPARGGLGDRANDTIRISHLIS
jgi:hypothetical protein